MSNTSSSDIRLAIFDLDGTLVNTITDLGNSVSFALEKLGLPKRTLEEYTRFVGNGTLKLVQRSVPEEYKNDEALIVRVHELFSEYYAEHFCDTSRVYDGMLKALEELKSQGIKLCVLTNKPDEFAVKIMDRLFPKGMFSHVQGAREGVPKKPDPTAELEIMRSFGADPANTIHIGDSDVDVFTAHNAGISCIGCSWGFRSRESLAEAGAEAIADEPMELPEIIADGLKR